MIIGIIVAMQAELDSLLQAMENVEKMEVNSFDFYGGHLGQNEVVAMQCGIGKVNAAVGALTLIEGWRPDAVINTGIAGGTGQGAGMLDVVAGEKVAYHDVWCGPGNLPGQVQGFPPAFTGATDLFGIPELARQGKVKCGLIASGDRFISTPEDLRQVLAVQPDAIAVDMESAAIAQVCAIRGLPFLAIRVISDTPGIENHLDQYADFWTRAPRETFAILKEIAS